MDVLNLWLLDISNWIWTYLLIGLCTLSGIYCTLRLRFVQFRTLPHAWQLLRGKYDEGCSDNDISTLQALATTLASTTGIGNIAGVAVAISLGGPGAVFWMWMMALLGMSLKFTEATLGSLYRRPEQGVSNGALVGGPMYYLAEGLGPKWRPVATLYAFLGTIAFLGAWNMFQANQASAIIQDQFAVPTWVTSTVLAFFSGLVLIGGIHRIGQVASKIVPTMCLIYLGGVVVILGMNLEAIPSAFGLIFTHAFNTDSAVGGAMGTAVLMGIRRAMFSNEAGVGSAAIAFAAAHSKYPIRQGVVASLGPFIDTVVVCTATALVIMISGFFGAESYQPANKQVLSFESGNAQYADGWVTSKNFPVEDKHSLQTLVAGKQVLRHDSFGEKDTLTIPLTSLLKPTLESTRESTEDAAQAESSPIDGIRFSVYRDRGEIQAQLINNTGIIETLNTGALGQGRWQSFVVPVSQTIGSDTFLQITSHAPEQAVMIDRVQPVSNAKGIVLSTAAFGHFLGPFGTLFVAFAALLFAYTSIIAGSYYGEVCSQYISGKLLLPYKWLYVASIFIGGIISLEIVINFSDIFLGLACIPNLIAMMLLSPKVAREEQDYFAALKSDDK